MLLNIERAVGKVKKTLNKKRESKRISSKLVLDIPENSTM
jgi:hypothetical protein